MWNTTGMYSIVRHPLYLGNFFVGFGIVLICSSVWLAVVFCLLFVVYYERLMFAEEEFLRTSSGWSSSRGRRAHLHFYQSSAAGTGPKGDFRSVGFFERKTVNMNYRGSYTD